MDNKFTLKIENSRQHTDYFEFHGYAEENADESVLTTQVISNRCLAIVEMMERNIQDLELLTYSLIDDNAKEIAQSVAAKMSAMLTHFNTETVDAFGGNDVEDYSCVELLGYLHSGGKQTLVIPKLRAMYQRLMSECGEEFTEEEFTAHLAHIRQQFNLSSEFGNQSEHEV